MRARKRHPPLEAPAVPTVCYCTKNERTPIAAAVLTIGLKTIAWWITDSVGLLSDAMESVVNLVGGLMAFAMLTVAERPADEDDPYGHGKAEYFSSGVEGTLILIAAVCTVSRLSTD